MINILVTNIILFAVSVTNSLSPMTPQEKTDAYIQQAEFRIESENLLVRTLAVEKVLEAVKEINARLTALENMKKEGGNEIRNYYSNADE